MTEEKLNQELMQVYKTYKVNPMGGCLPMALQIPVFFALYRMLNSAVELRHQPFTLWIHDLTAPDRLNIGFCNRSSDDRPFRRAAGFDDPDGHNNVPAAKNDAVLRRPSAGKDHANHADHVYIFLYQLPGRSCAILVCKQYSLDCPAILDKSSCRRLAVVSPQTILSFCRERRRRACQLLNSKRNQSRKQ